MSQTNLKTENIMWKVMGLPTLKGVLFFSTNTQEIERKCVQYSKSAEYHLTYANKFSNQWENYWNSENNRQEVEIVICRSEARVVDIHLKRCSGSLLIRENKNTTFILAKN